MKINIMQSINHSFCGGLISPSCMQYAMGRAKGSGHPLEDNRIIDSDMKTTRPG